MGDPTTALWNLCAGAPGGNLLNGPRRKKRGKPEAKVQKQIVQWLLKQGVIVAITDAGALARVGLGMSCGIPTGWPDITGCTRTGRFLGVECKAAKGRQSTGQILFQQRILENGGIYILAHSLEEFLEKFALTP
jgi:hypothetical protein